MSGERQTGDPTEAGGQFVDPVKDVVLSLITGAIILVTAAIILAPLGWLAVRLWRWALGA